MEWGNRKKRGEAMRLSTSIAVDRQGNVYLCRRAGAQNYQQICAGPWCCSPLKSMATPAREGKRIL